MKRETWALGEGALWKIEFTCPLAEVFVSMVWLVRRQPSKETLLKEES